MSVDEQRLIQFNEKYVLEPRGMPNITGMHCYWNSTLQALISCPQFISVIIKLSNNRGQIVDHLISFIDGKMTNMELYKTYIVYLHKIGKSTEQLKELTQNQQCVGETLTYFLEIFEKVNSIFRLFQHRSAYQLKCINCGYISKTTTNNIIFEVMPNTDLTKELNSSVDIIEDYKCEKCGDRKNKPKKGNLTMIPEIISVIVKNYLWEGGVGKKQMSASDFPEYIQIGEFQYRAVSYIDHFGRLDFGHYISTCLRRKTNGELGWFLFNDDKVSPTDFAPSINTYMALYVFEKSVEGE